MAATSGSPGRCRSTFTSELSSRPVLSRSRQPIRFWGSLSHPFLCRTFSWALLGPVPALGSFLGSRKPAFTAGGWPVAQLQHGLKVVCDLSDQSRRTAIKPRIRLATEGVVSSSPALWRAERDDGPRVNMRYSKERTTPVF